MGDDARVATRLWLWKNAVNLTAAKFTLTKEFSNLEHGQLRPIIDVLWIDLAHAILKTYPDYNCADGQCFMAIIPTRGAHAMFEKSNREFFNNERFAEAVMRTCGNMRRCTELFFRNILK